MNDNVGCFVCGKFFSVVVTMDLYCAVMSCTYEMALCAVLCECGVKEGSPESWDDATHPNKEQARSRFIDSLINNNNTSIIE